MSIANTLEGARTADASDPLARYRDQFIFPQHNGQNVVYLTGNSLGLQPKKAREIVNEEFDDWGKFGVEGHFEARRPWYAYHEFLTEKAAQLVGAEPIEVVVMNALTVNLHLLMVSFYQPTNNRFKILCEKKAFPSDQYALESQVRFHGFDPKEAIIEVEPREGEHTLRTEDIINTIKVQGEEIALVMMGGVNYYTGQLLDMKAIAQAARDKYCVVGFDLAHAAGNVPLSLHEWGVDFACWCSYKYLNSGPGGVAGAFVHRRHSNSPELPRFAGWWGYDKKTRFEMKPGFKPMAGAEGWQLSNAPVFSMAMHKASLDIFSEIGMQALRTKSTKLTAYLEHIIQEVSKNSEKANFEIITPKDPAHRGAQLSVLCHGQGKELFDELTRNGVVADWREPNVIRMAPVPMYNSFEDVYRFGQILEKACG